MVLGIDYNIISSIVIIVFLYLVFRYQRSLRNIFFDSSGSINKDEIIKYLQTTYPKFNFDISIFNKTDQKLLIVEDFALQFTQIETNFPISANTLEHNLLWDAYIVNSKPPKGKLPNDIKKRREGLLYRDKNCCQRCSRKLDIESVKIFFLKPIEDDGDYSFENMISVCNDCNRVLLTNNINKTIPELEIYDTLYSIV